MCVRVCVGGGGYTIPHISLFKKNPCIKCLHTYKSDILGTAIFTLHHAINGPFSYCKSNVYQMIV